MRLVLLVLLLVLGLPGVASAADRVIVGFEPGVEGGERAAARSAVDAVLVETLGDPATQLVRGADPAALEALPGVAYAEPDALVRTQWAPGDPRLVEQWALPITSVPAAWDGARGAGVTVGVVDTGVEAGHPDLAGRFDPVRGPDLVNDDADPADDNGHGTLVGGVIAASAGNGVGVAGVAPEASMVHVKALDARGSGYTSDVTAGLRHLGARGIRVVNLSLGGDSSSSAMSAAIAAYPQTLFVVAAGNQGADNDASSAGTWPCNDPGPNVLCVGASTRADARAGFSNVGTTSVDLMAPGDALLTTRLGSTYGNASGTSFSAPMVAGAAALLLSARPQATVAGLRAALLDSVDPVAAFSTLTVTGGRLDAQAALSALTGAPPAPASAAPEPVAAPVAPPAPVAAAPAPAPVVPPAPAPVTAPRAPETRRPTPRAKPVRCGSARFGSRRARAAAKRCVTRRARAARARRLAAASRR